MKRYSQRGIYNAVADINIVPMMDLVWNLLIVFMLATPLLEQSIHLKLPEAKSGAPVDTNDIVTIHLDSAGRIHLDQTIVTSAQLGQAARALIQRNPQQAVVVRGDKNVPYGRFVEIVDQLKLAGVSKLGIASLGTKP